MLPAQAPGSAQALKPSRGGRRNLAIAMAVRTASARLPTGRAIPDLSRAAPHVAGDDPSQGHEDVGHLAYRRIDEREMLGEMESDPVAKRATSNGRFTGKHVLAAAGADFSYVVKETMFIEDVAHFR